MVIKMYLSSFFKSTYVKGSNIKKSNIKLMRNNKKKVHIWIGN